jgi:hypothetical protein
VKKFIGIREEWMRPLPKLQEMFLAEEEECHDEAKSSKKTSKKTSEKKDA